MNDSINKIIDFDFFSYSPIFAQGHVQIAVPILERLDDWKQVGIHLEVPLEDLNIKLPFGDAECYAIKIPKGQATKISYDGYLGIYTPKLAPTLGGVANYNVGRIYPKEDNIIIFESKNSEINIEQNLVEDYHHVIFKFGKEIQKSSVITEPVKEVTPEPEILSESEKRVRELEEELKRLKGGI
jgi:hypothetical protein